MIVETVIELLLAGIGTSATAAAVTAARSGTWDKSEAEIANGGHAPIRFEPPAMPMPAIDPWPLGFVPTAFWNLADYDEKNIRDGGQPFWMRDPVEFVAPKPETHTCRYAYRDKTGDARCTDCGHKMIDPVKEAQTDALAIRGGLAPMPHNQDWTHGVCPTCAKPVRQIEIDERKVYVCSNKRCVKSKETWAYSDADRFVIVTHPTRWVLKSRCLYDEVHGWYLKPTGPIDYDAGEPPRRRGGPKRPKGTTK